MAKQIKYGVEARKALEAGGPLAAAVRRVRGAGPAQKYGRVPRQL